MSGFTTTSHVEDQLHHAMGGTPEELLYDPYVAMRPVPSLGVEPGDFLVRKEFYGPDALQRMERLVRGRAVQVPRSGFAALLQDVEAFASLPGADRGLRLYLSDRRRWNGRDDSSPLFIVRPWHGPVTEPVEATSDEAAIFELILASGGRMPEEEA